MVRGNLGLWATLLAASPFATASPVVRDQVTASAACRVIPGDAAWPSQSVWHSLNSTVGGRLIEGKPLAQICYASRPTAAAEAQCATLQDDWTFSLDDPVNVMSPYWMNRSCSPFDASSGSCTLGNLPSYAINVSTASDVVAGVQFATIHNIRLVVKNTGHDFLGRSAGAGALSMWTHNMKQATVIKDYKGSTYQGPAMRIGAGITNIELFTAADAAGYRAVGGSCPTVGAGGGYMQLAGHGPLGAKYGLGVDQVLEYEVVTADGAHVVSSPSQNADLYWALAGGGPGNFGILVSTTVKVFKDGPIAGAGFAFSNTGPNYWEAVAAWIQHLLVLNEIKGFGTLWEFTALGFSLEYASLPDHGVADMTAALAPFFAKAAALNVTIVNKVVNQHPSYLTHYGAWATQTYDTNNSVGGRLIPRETVQHNLTQLMAVFQDITVDSAAVGGSAITGISADVSHARVGNGVRSNAVLPAWRASLFNVNIGIPLAEDAGWAAIRLGQAQLNAWQDAVRAVTPGGGTYMNEATYDNPNWKADYYGSNYEELLRLKNKYDPHHLLWVNAGVGSDVTWQPAPDGRLCRV